MVPSASLNWSAPSAHSNELEEEGSSSDATNQGTDVRMGWISPRAPTRSLHQSAGVPVSSTMKSRAIEREQRAKLGALLSLIATRLKLTPGLDAKSGGGERAVEEIRRAGVQIE